MLHEGGALREGLGTRPALMGLLPRVGPQMPDEGQAVTAGPTVGVTPVGSLPSVCALVLREVRHLGAGPATLFAHIWLLTCVHTHML